MLHQRIRLILLGLLFIPALAWSESPNDEQIQGVITAQLTAFLNNDASGAWLHAHPSIQVLFGNPESFMAMVDQGYSPMKHFVQLDFLKLVQVDDMWLQTVRLLDDKGDRYDLLYALIETQPGLFQIAGVSLEANTGI
ncbi:DUF4864 domain-containing protein [Reinekea sp. G2M2-21]|uniref:DUF4864 domain-containing protein n=1 Tax=Reinekea sp. G2M2-21 TaxID=2788942 RepID=UPI0018ABF34D|nr:DUF4864 domain-containing protein [Reinekea sp. G2M2-21]